jgi:hypothetical protein
MAHNYCGAHYQLDSLGVGLDIRATQPDSCNHPLPQGHDVGSMIGSSWCKACCALLLLPIASLPISARADQQALFHPGSSVFIGTPAISILAAKERAAHAAGNAVEEAGGLWINDVMAGISHAITLRLSQSHRYPPVPHERVSQGLIMGGPDPAPIPPDLAKCRQIVAESIVLESDAPSSAH